MGYWGEDLEITITFNAPIKINTLELKFYDAPGQWIYAPLESKLQTEAIDLGMLVGTFYAETISDNLKSITFPMNGERFSELKISIPNYGIIPEGMQGAGNKAWTFIDEIVID